MFSKVLIANRGEIAVRVIRSCRRLGIRTVAVYSDADAEASHVKLADEAIHLGEPPVTKSYLCRERLIEALLVSGADAVHPGYGLLSEDRSFAQAVTSAGRVFVGPSAVCLGLFGNKLEARRLAKTAGLATLPGSDGPIPGDDLACAQAEASRIGWPILVKPAHGGGGIGMQVVREIADFGTALRSCADRGRAAFGNPEVYIERYVEAPRHIEVQVLIDGRGQGVCLGERECSVQRRHQKVIEEAPSPASFLAGALGEQRRRELFQGALELLRSVGYTGAGTVEFLADEQGEFYFLEVNARIQVEHPVTEMVTGLDLVEWQLRIAAGEPLSDSVLGINRPSGHAIEARLYAEDPARNFAPQPGTVDSLSWPESSTGLRIDTALVQGEVVTPHYDPLLAKLIAWGETRAEALSRLKEALGATRLILRGPKGERRTNQALLLELLESPAFRRGAYDTSLVNRVLAGGGSCPAN